MRKSLVVASALFLALAIAGSLISTFRDPEGVASAASMPWPRGLGSLDAAIMRYPERDANDASRNLIVLAEALPKQESIDAFVTREISRGDRSIGKAPELAEAQAIRAALLREQLVWKTTSDVGDSESIRLRAAQMVTAKLLVAMALHKASSGDSQAWDDLRAVWNLARSLDESPQMMSRTASMSMIRMINAVAWKMPLPAPPWLSELHQHDFVQSFLEAFQWQTAVYWRSGTQMFPTTWLAASVDHDRRIAEEVSRLSGCQANVKVNRLGTDHSSIWRRAFRYRAEREASANALRLREGKPIVTDSICEDATWSFDGTILSLDREIPTTPSDKSMTLLLRPLAY